MMKNIITFFFSLIPFLLLSQEIIRPFYDAPNTCPMINDFVRDNDLSESNGKIVTVGVNSAIAKMLYSTNQYTQKTLEDLYGPEDIIIIYQSFTYIDKKMISPDKILLCFEDYDGVFTNIKNDECRFYPIDITNEKDILKLQRWGEKTNLPYAGSEELEDWLWFRENARFRISVSTTIDGKEKVTMIRLLPEYFIQSLETN